MGHQTITPIVPATPDAPSAGMSRREIMNAMTAIAAVPAMTMPLPKPAQALPIDDAPDGTDEAYENGLEVAREEFALAWLKMWTAAGGTVIADGRTSWIGMPCFSLAPGRKQCVQQLRQIRGQDWFKKMSKRDREARVNGIRSMYRDRYEGMMRGLTDLLDSIPEGAATVKKIVGIVPQLGRGTF